MPTTTINFSLTKFAATQNMIRHRLTLLVEINFNRKLEGLIEFNS